MEQHRRNAAFSGKMDFRGTVLRKDNLGDMRISEQYYQGGPPSAHATPIRLPNGQLVTHKRMYFDIRKPGNPFYDSDFF